MSVELSYRVIHLAQVGGSVKMVLEEVRTVPPEEIERARQEADREPETDVVDAGNQLGKVEFDPDPVNPYIGFLRAIKKEFPEMMRGMSVSQNPGTSGESARMMPIPTYKMIEAYLTHEQYDELGSPPLLSIIKINMCSLAKG